MEHDAVAESQPEMILHLEQGFFPSLKATRPVYMELRAAGLDGFTAPLTSIDHPTIKPVAGMRGGGGEGGADLDGCGVAALLAAAGVGDHAVGAALVAAEDDVDPGRQPAVPPRHRHILQDVDGVHRQHLAAQVHLVQQCVDPADQRTHPVSWTAPGTGFLTSSCNGFLFQHGSWLS